MCACANQNTQVTTIHINQICMCALCANHDEHDSRLTSHMHMCAVDVHVDIIDYSYTSGLCCEHFQKHVVAIHMCSQV